MKNSNTTSPIRGRQRMMVYCHDSVGLGHFRRSLAICEHLAGEFKDASFLLATGTPFVPLFQLPDGVDFVKLPSLTKREDGTYASKYLGVTLRHLLDCRRALLLATVQYYRPTVFLVDKAPLGVCREMIPTLKWVQRNCPETKIVFGMRDIEDAPGPTMAQWQADGVLTALEEGFDEIWVYGTAAVFDVVQEYELSPKIESKLRYAGYIERKGCAHVRGPKSSGDRVLVTVGGGTDGSSLLHTYFADAALRVARRGGHSTVVGGPDLPAAAAMELKRTADRLPNTTWLQHTSCMPCHMQNADLVVCMGGYNTMCEVVSFEKPALVVPRIRPRSEQAIRAARWQRMGLVRTMHPSTVSPDRLGGQVVDMLDEPVRPDRTRLDLSALSRISARFSLFGEGAGSRASTVCM